jgi:hypothetical protein
MPMQMDAFLWLFLPVFVAGGSALLSFYIMQARMEVALAKERESLAEARAIINSHKATMEERIKAAEEATRRATLDELMRDLRVEERSYVRENKALARRSMVMQERVFFRNIPLSAWSEHEMVIEDGSAALPQGAAAHALAEGERLPISKLLGEIGAAPAAPQPEARFTARPALPRENRALVPAHAAFGAQ